MMNACLRRGTQAYSVSYHDFDDEGVEMAICSKRREEAETLFYVQFNPY